MPGRYLVTARQPGFTPSAARPVKLDRNHPSRYAIRPHARCA